MARTARHSALHSQSGMMFGLDARLAMLIFALLAVVAGYVGFGRIAIARQAALVGELQAYEQALEHYQADMGTFYLFTLNKPVNDDSSIEDIRALWDVSMVKPGFQGHWNGPYFTTETRKSRNYGNYSIFYAQKDRRNYCTTDSDCYIWLSLTQVPEKIWKQVNAYVDEANGAAPENPGDDISSGKVQADAPTDPRTLIYRTIERPQQQ